MRIILFILSLTLGGLAYAQQDHFLPLTPAAEAVEVKDSATAQHPFKGHYFCAETGVNIYLDLYEESLEAPGFSFLGKMNGYMKGGIYGTWMLIKHKVEGNKATLRFSNDIGSDSQDIIFTQTSDSTFTYRTIGGNAIRKAEGQKLVKVTGNMDFKKVQ